MSFRNCFMEFVLFQIFVYDNKNQYSLVDTFMCQYEESSQLLTSWFNFHLDIFYEITTHNYLLLFVFTF